MTPRTSADQLVRQPAAENEREREHEAQRVDVNTLVDQLPAILYVADVGSNGRWHYVSHGVEAILGFTREQWLAEPEMWARQVHPDDRDRVFDREDALLDPTVPDEYRMLHRNGATVWVRDEAALVTDAAGRLQWHGVISDITDRKLAEAELERRAEQQAAVARLGRQALGGADLSELMEEALREATRITGAGAAAVLEQAPDSGLLTVRAEVGLSALTRAPDGCARASGAGGSHPLHGPEARAPADSPAASYLPSELPHGVAGRIDGRAGPWGKLWLTSAACAPLDEADTSFVQALANILADAIQRRATEEEIRYQGLHDPLTGLPNRLLLLERLGKALFRPGAQVAVVLLDIDNFKLINDSLGHAAGDELLIQIAPRLRTAVRPEDVIARLGGDEFVVLLDHVGADRSAALVAQRIVAAFEAPFALHQSEHFAKVSVGIALADRRSTPASLIRDADAALYHAKASGRARFEVFDELMRTRTVERLSLENDLRRALERGQLHIIYQPIVSLRERTIESVEALLRWEHPDRGTVSPVDFIPVAEECGMIEPIGRWVLTSACEQVSSWQRTYPACRALGISVNLSARQFKQSELHASVAHALAVSGIQPSSLSLEITESVLLDESQGVTDAINAMAALGVRFVLDDFGTGYSSLAYLSGLPIDGLKVDRSFVHALGGDGRSAAITTAIVRMAQALSIEVIAEGVENDRQLRTLRAIGCELAQGFYLHRPMSAAAIAALLGSARVAEPPRDRLRGPRARARVSLGR